MKSADIRSPRFYQYLWWFKERNTKYIVRRVRGYQQYIIKGPTYLSTLVLSVKIREAIKEKKYTINKAENESIVETGY